MSRLIRLDLVEVSWIFKGHCADEGCSCGYLDTRNTCLRVKSGSLGLWVLGFRFSTT